MRGTHVRRHAPALGLILALAFTVRFVWVLFVHPDPTDGRFDDTVWYRGAAHFLANGDGYVNTFTGTPTAAWPPGYPFFLGAVFKVLGEGLWQTYSANIMLGVATVAVVYAIGIVLFERRTAALAAGALAVWPGQVYFTSLTLSEPLFTLLFVLAVLLLLLVPRARRGGAAIVVLFGMVLTLAMLTRGQAALLLPVAVVYWGVRAGRWQGAIGRGMLAAAVVGLMLAPWVARNERELGSPVIIATNIGPNVWIGHHQGASGRMFAPAPPYPERGDMTQPEFEVAADRLALKKGLRFMLTHPVEEIGLSVTKLRAMYESDANGLDWNSRYRDEYFAYGLAGPLRATANGFWFAALAFSAAGLVTVRQRLRDGALVLPLIALGWTAMHLLFFGDSRFHYPIVFVFALLGARGLIVIFEALRRPQLSTARGYAEA